jgi:UDP-N-acetylglucosamine diphosphorylase / glucose-1-phosphate thymidylyltransferase / UDP-N-acetylgalactosamine diphosphorylase / glucosamine-1-phosphate N-acetyltransferase / galactosamine-1-phosphate N-acetyltransferase
MKALILAAGRGARLGALTAHRPKPMLPLGGKPMLERIMTGIAQETGIVEFVLVTGYCADVIEDYFGSGARWGWQITYIHQAKPDGVGAAVNCARDVLRDTVFLMTYGDIMDHANYRAIAALTPPEWGGGGSQAIVGLNWVDDPWRGAAVYLDAQGHIARIEEKPARGTARTHWNNAGLFVFDPLIFDYTARLKPSPRGEYELPDAITAMIADGCRVQGFEITGAWRDVGTPEDYAAINAEWGAAP